MLYECEGARERAGEGREDEGEGEGRSKVRGSGWGDERNDVKLRWRCQDFVSLVTGRTFKRLQ